MPVLEVPRSGYYEWLSRNPSLSVSYGALFDRLRRRQNLFRRLFVDLSAAAFSSGVLSENMVY